MATTITMPQLGETVTEGTVAQWLKKPGDSVEKYEAFVEVSTDKVNAEVPSPVTGVDPRADRQGRRDRPDRRADRDHRRSRRRRDAGARRAAPPAARRRASSVGAKRTAMAVDEPVPGGNVGLGGPSYTAPRQRLATAHAATARHDGRLGDGTRRRRLRVSPAVRRLAREHSIDLGARARHAATTAASPPNDILAAAKAGPSAGVAATISADNAEYVAPASAAAAAPPRSARRRGTEAARHGASRRTRTRSPAS